MGKSKRKCKNCKRDISHKHVNAKFCSNKGFRNCKDLHHNIVSPRGYGLKEDESVDEYDGSWDAHNY